MSALKLVKRLAKPALVKEVVTSFLELAGTFWPFLMGAVLLVAWQQQKWVLVSINLACSILLWISMFQLLRFRRKANKEMHEYFKELEEVIGGLDMTKVDEALATAKRYYALVARAGAPPGYIAVDMKWMQEGSKIDPKKLN